MILVPSVGPKDADIVIVGEAPGKNEERKGEPFVGLSGTLMREAFIRAGAPTMEFFITNVCKARPPGNDIAKWFKLNKKTIKMHEHVKQGIVEMYLELAEVRPNIIVPLGNVALWALTGKGAIGKRRGSLMQVEPNMRLLDFLFKTDRVSAEIVADCLAILQGAKIVPTIHPAAILRTWGMLPIFRRDVEKIVRESKFPEFKVPERNIIVDPEKDDIIQAAEKLHAAEWNSCDIETAGGQMYCIGFAWSPNDAIVIRPHDSWRREIIKELLASKSKKIFQYGTFDVGFLKKYELMDVNNFAYDTIVAQRIAYPEYPASLEFQCSIYTDEPYYKDEGKVYHPSKITDPHRFMLYCGKDVCVTMEAAFHQMKNELADSRRKETMRRKMRVLPFAVEQTIRGLQLDTIELFKLESTSARKVEELQKDLDNHITNMCLAYLDDEKKSKPQKAAAKKILENIAKTAAGKRKSKYPGLFNPASSTDVPTYIYDMRGFKPWGARKVSRSAKEEVLKQLYGETSDKILKLILDIRKERTQLSRYLRVKYDANGRIYWSVNVAGTKTLRWTTGNELIHDYGANMQTWPQPIRKVIVADRDHVLFYPDLAQAEDRIVSYWADVRRKIQAFENDEDVHSVTASNIFRIPVEEVIRRHKERQKKERKEGAERYLGKQSNHAFNYGETAPTFFRGVNKKADETGVSITYAFARDARNAHLRLYPEIETGYWDAIQTELHRSRTLTNLFGSIRMFPGRMDDDTYKDAYSWIPQSTVPELIDLACARAADAGLPFYMALHMHDAPLLMLHKSTAREVAEEFLEHMKIPLIANGKEFIIPCDGKIGENWGEMEDL